jgi:hypothetical protein
MRLEVGSGDGFALAGVGHDHAAEATFQVGEVAGEAEDGHHLGGHGDVEPVLAREAVGDPAKAGDDLAKGTVVHVDDTAPSDAALVDAEVVAPVEMIVEEGRQEVVGAADGVEVAGEVEVDLLHRHHLRVAAASGPALHAEAGAERGLAQADGGTPADPVEAIAQAYRGGGLALAGGRGVDGGHKNEAAGLGSLQGAQVVEVDLRDMAAVLVECLGRDAQALGHGTDRLERRGAGDLDVRRNAHRLAP